MPKLKPFKISIRPDDWQGVERQLNKVFSDLYDRIGGYECIDGRTFSRDTISATNLSATGLTGLLLVSVDADGQFVTVADLTAWIAGGIGITITDDGNGSLTVKVKQQNHEVDAVTAHNVAGADHVSQVNTEAALNALGTKINNILTKLETAEILKNA